MLSTNDVRRDFLDYFERNGHLRISSAPLLPHNDPTLMFVNAGMVPFKNIFTGLEVSPHPTVVSNQKCIRAGGKHNDLDNVGYTARHHSFFEMLGNFSFGDYFKEEAILHAWTLLTKDWGIDPERLIATVYHTDDSAYELWRKIAGLPASRIIRIPTRDNFWALGPDGPCGPCSKIFYDHGEHVHGGPPGSPDEDGDRFVELWNLVFMQFAQENDVIIGELPRPSISTGIGLERIAAVLQGVHDNYDIDIFAALIDESAALTRTTADGEYEASHRVIADHLRASGFLIADGVLPSNQGRGYVLRRIMRRAMRHAFLLGAKDPLIHQLVPSLVSEMGQAYPELIRAQPLIEATLAREETRFRRTLAGGLELLDEATANLAEGGTLPGATAFKLYDTYGFPYDLTEDALRAQGLSIDRAGFDAAMAEQKDKARAAWRGSDAKAAEDLWFDITEEFGRTEFTGYASTQSEGRVEVIVSGEARVEHAGAGEAVVILTNQTPFYAERGGQAGDRGIITGPKGLRAKVRDTTMPIEGLHAHQAVIEAGELRAGDAVHLAVDEARREKLRANHSATHLLHSALRKVLGTGASQRGGKIEADRLTLEFTWDEGLTAEEIAGVEAEVNAQIRRNEAVTTRLMTPDDALAQGALAHFGEKYGDEVRVLSIGRGEDRPYSLELCAGTHVSATGDIAVFKIVSDNLAGPRLRRLEALTGQAAFDFMSGRTVAQDLQAQSDALLQPAQRDFFISYTGKNLELAQEVGAILREAGFTFYAQFQDFDTGSNFVLGMQDGLRHSKRVIALVSPAYVRAPHCRTEWAAAYNSDPEGKARRLLPFLIEETDQDPLGLQIVYKRLVGLSQADRKRVILETISAQPLTPEAVQLLRNLAEATSPDFRAVDKTKLHGEPNAKLDTPEYGDELASLPTTQRTIAGLLIECLSDNVPPVIRRCLSQYREHLADHGVRPMVGLLAQIHSAIDAEFNIFGRTNIGDGAADLLASFGKNHRQLMTHFPGNAQREGLYRRNPVREEAASGDALFNPIKEVAGYLREIAALGQTTEEFDRILAVWEQYASDIAHLPPAPPGRTGEASPKQRLVLSSIGYMRRIQEVIQSTPALRNTVPGEVLLRRLPHIIDTFLGFVK